MSDAQAAPTGAMAEGGAEAQGRATVRARFVAVLDAAGMVRRKGVTEAAHREWLGRLCDRLAYMSPANLDTLAAEMIARGLGPNRNEWPSEVMICGFAEALQRRPFRDLPIVSSWLRSVEGPVALAGGYLVELLAFLRRRGVPPSAYDMRQIRIDAEEARRKAERVRERMAAGAPWADDGPWLEQRMRDEAFARQLVEAGIEHREQKGAA